MGVAENIIEMDFKEVQRGGNWLDLSSSVQVPAAKFCGYENKYESSKNSGKFFNNWALIIFSKEVP